MDHITELITTIGQQAVDLLKETLKTPKEAKKYPEWIRNCARHCTKSEQ